MNEILQYQEFDGQIRKIESEIKNSDERKKARTRKAFLSQVGELAQKMDKKAFDLKSKYAGIEAVLNNRIAELEDFNGVANSLDAHTAVEYNVKRLDKISGEIKGLEKELEDVAKDIEHAVKEFSDLQEKNKIAIKEYALYKEKYEKIKEEKQPKIAELTAKLKTFESKVDKDLLKKYNDKKEQKIYPVFVKANGDMCGGCSMEISLAAKNKLGAQKIIECDECKRYIYIE